MFNRYLAEDREAFEDLYRPVEGEKVVSSYAEQEAEPVIKEEVAKKHEKEKLSLNGILKKLNIGEIGLLPLLLLVFLVLDVDDDEKLLIFALAIVLGI